MPSERRSRFFVGMSIVLLLIVLVGFARTFYLRAFFDVPAVPLHVYLHGGVLTAWFVWFCVQSSLVAAGRSDLHRRLGIVGALIGAAVIVANVTVLTAMGPRLRALLEHGPFDPAFIVAAIWGDFGSTVAFAALLSCGLWYRHRPQIHRRLMLLASVSIVGQALGRIATWPLFAGIPNLAPILSVGALVFFIGGLAIYDFTTTRRVHPATMLGGAFRVVVWSGSIVLAASEFGRAVVHALA
jgi:hypothetical protein